jgi:menaquinol-cytochrome c reductase iron-sulfur subunit
MFKMKNTDTTNGTPTSTPAEVEDVLVPPTHEATHSTHAIDATPEQIKRRQFLSRLSIGLSGVIGVGVAAPVVAYLIAPLFKEVPTDIWRDVGAVYDFKIGETKEVAFDDAQSVAWAGVTSRTAAWLRREGENEFRAFAVNCTHLGCPVSWLPSANLFECPCHGGVYYADGRVAGGPPPQRLNEYKVRVNAARVEIQASGIPITS